jgi:hypothetical protein
MATSFVRDRDLVNPLLAARADRALNRLNWQLFDLLPTLEPRRSEGEQILSGLLPSHPGRSLVDLGPVPLQDGAPFVPLDYHGIEVFDPSTRDPNATGTDILLGRMLPLIDLAQDLCSRVPDRLKDPISCTLAYQFCEIASDASHDFNLMRSHMRAPIAAGQPGLTKELLDRERAEEERRRADANMLVLGEDRIPTRYVKIGVTRDGRYIAISLSSPQFIILIGAQGFGKSHLGVLLAEGAALDLLGINQLGEMGPSRVWTFVNEWRKKNGNRQALQGVFPNPFPHEVAYLREVMGYVGNAAYERLVAVVLPGTRARYLMELPDLIERGVEIVEGYMHRDELTPATYMMLLNNGTQELGRDKPRWMSYIEQLIAEEGRGLPPRRLCQILESRKIGTETLFKQLMVLDMFISEHEHLGRHLGDRAPRVALLESTTVARDLLLPMQVVFMNTLRGAVTEDMHLVLIQEEGNKALENAAVREAVMNWGSEVRHGQVTTVLSGQTVKNIPPELWPLVTAGGLFYVPSPQVFKKMQELVGPLGGSSYKEVMEMQIGEALLWGVWVSDPRYRGRMIPAKLRPSCVRAGGETRTFR